MARNAARSAHAAKTRRTRRGPERSESVAIPGYTLLAHLTRGSQRGRPLRGLLATLLFSLPLLSISPTHAAESRVIDLATPGGGERAQAIEVSASIAPLAWMIERIGGSHVRTNVLMPPFASPESFSPSPKQLERLAHARLCVVVGHPNLVFEKRILRPFLEEHSEIPTVDFYAASASPAAPGARPESEPAGNPHAWLSPKRVLRAAPSIASALSMLDPQHKTEYDAGLRALLRDVQALDDLLRARFQSPAEPGAAPLPASPARLFLAQHPAWGWLAHDYGLEEVSIEREGKEPGPRRLVALIAWAKLSGVRQILVESGHPAHSARLIAREIDAQIVVVDPMAHDWLANLREVSEQIDAAAVDAQPGLSAP